jgi:1-acyl-sn-glycerol-3-phosphate acyltransferase
MLGLRPVLDWTATLLFLPVFGAVLLLFEIIQRAAKVFGKRAHDYSVACLCTSLVAAFRVTGLRIQVERSAAVVGGRPYLIISNHQSMFDIALLGHLFFTNFPKFVSKRELARRIPSVSYNLRRGGNALIDRDDAAQALQAIAALGRRVERNRVSAAIFPEGTRGRGGELRTFKPRGSLALFAAAPATHVVPVTIENSWRLMRANFLPIPFGVRVLVRIGDPIPRLPGEDHARLLAQAHHEITANLAAMRGEPAALPLRAAAR